MSNKKIENLPICLLAAAPAMLEALEFVKEWFARLEDGTDADDPLRAVRAKFHAPVHARIDAAIKLAKGESHV